MNYQYPKNYSPKPLKDQLKTLTKHFPNLKGMKLPEEPENKLESIFLIPSWQLIATTYSEACRKVFEAITSTRKTYAYVNFSNIKETDRKAAMWKDNVNCIVISAQFGEKHKGKSVKQVRNELEMTQEVPLGGYETGIMLLTHPERLQDFNDLWIDCGGDTYVDGGSLQAPVWSFNGGELEFDTKDVDGAHENYGSASGFLPQLKLESRPLAPLEIPLTLEAAIEKVKAEGYLIFKSI